MARAMTEERVSDGMYAIDIPARWIFLPPVVAIFVMAAMNFFPTGPSVPVDMAVWVLVAVLFIILTVLYALFLRENFSAGLFPVQLIAQGLLLCPLSLWMGARMLQWVGVTLASCGAATLGVIYYRSHAALVRSRDAAVAWEFDAFPLACVVVDKEGGILSVNDAMLKLTQTQRSAVIGENLSVLMPLDEDQLSAGGKLWTVCRSLMEDGHICVFLEEAHEEPPVHAVAEGSAQFNDPATTLYARAYAEARVNEEIARVRRYHRWMSAVLLRMLFQGTEKQLAKEEEIFNAYCRFVKTTTRTTDVAALVGPRDILVLMPETHERNAETALSKLADFAPALQKELADFDGVAEIQDSVVFLSSLDGNMDFEQLMRSLDKALESRGSGE
jgi:hypothetical protein